jgi:hypothetical protein
MRGDPAQMTVMITITITVGGLITIIITITTIIITIAAMTIDDVAFTENHVAGVHDVDKLSLFLRFPDGVLRHEICTCRRSTC